MTSSALESCWNATAKCFSPQSAENVRKNSVLKKPIWNSMSGFNTDWWPRQQKLSNPTSSFTLHNSILIHVLFDFTIMPGRFSPRVEMLAKSWAFGILFAGRHILNISFKLDLSLLFTLQWELFKSFGLIRRRCHVNIARRKSFLVWPLRRVSASPIVGLNQDGNGYFKT